MRTRGEARTVGIAASSLRSEATMSAVVTSRLSQSCRKMIAWPVFMSSLAPKKPGTRVLTRWIGLSGPVSGASRASTFLICATV